MSVVISIIIPVFNRSGIIENTLDSVINQSYTNWECILVDDGSNDNSVEILNKYKSIDGRFKVYSRPENTIKGAPTCRNIGIFKAVGEHVVFLDSDDTLEKHCLENRVQKFKVNPDKDFLIFPMGVMRDGHVSKKEITSKTSYLEEFLSYRLPWSIMCPIWKRDFLIKLKGFKEGYPRLNDPELMIRALLVQNVKFIVFNDEEYDTIYYPSISNWTLITDKYYDSLVLFIPDICKALELVNKHNLKPHLSNYLKIWYRDFMFPSNKNLIRQNTNLISLFYKQSINSLVKTMCLKILLYAHIFTHFVKRKLVKKIIKLT
ncbi:glycosyltransferase [Flavobacteriaceae bacterium]|nr:glycosyltransferase [Algibacter sp.]MDA9069410.1 glycosyltransferase [Algibacter sp.]MDB9859401.1 glycosyltransferase [Flavobacteriaceae bacterium]